MELYSQQGEPATADLPVMLLSNPEDIASEASVLCHTIMEHDIDADRSFQVRQSVKKAVIVYQELMMEKK